MKIRTDFVTNSSSSSFVIATVSTNDAWYTIPSVDEPENGLLDEKWKPAVVNGQLCVGYNNEIVITDIFSLVASIMLGVASPCFADIDDASLVLRYLSDYISGKDFVNEICELKKSDKKWFAYKNVNFNELSEEEIKNEFLNNLEAETEWPIEEFEDYLNLCKSVKSLSEITSIEFQHGRNESGSELPVVEREMVPQERMEELVGEPFPHIDCENDRESFVAAADKWEKAIRQQISINGYTLNEIDEYEGSFELMGDVYEAIEQGDYELAWAEDGYIDPTDWIEYKWTESVDLSKLNNMDGASIPIDMIDDVTNECDSLIPESLDGKIASCKEARPSVDENRLKNAVTANASRSQGASNEQLGWIKIIENTIGLDSIDETLRVLCEKRKMMPDADLSEIGAALDPPIQKSGVYKRFKKIQSIAEEQKLDV